MGSQRVWHDWATFTLLMEKSACSAGDLGSIPGSGRFPGEENGKPLQYSCLENPMEGGAWQATVHGVIVRHNWETLLFSKPDVARIKMAWSFSAKTGPPDSQGEVGLAPSLQGVVPRERRDGGDSVLVHPAELSPPSLVQSWPLSEPEAALGHLEREKGGPLVIPRGRTP